MKNTKPLWIAALLPILWAGCNGRPQDRAVDQYVVYSSYRDIPGITAEEIDALEALKIRKRSGGGRDYFTYGMMLSTEIFYNEEGRIEGYSALFCDWLSTLFGIPFKPAVYQWGELLAGLESLEIDFTGELTATEERRSVYFLSDAIAEHSVKYMRLTGSEELSETAKRRPLRYAFLRDTVTPGLVVPHITGDFEYLFVDNHDAAYRMLKDGAIDAFFEENIAEAAFDLYGDVQSYDFFPFVYAPVSLATRNPDLEPVISAVQKALRNGGMRYLIDLYNQGQKSYMRHRLFARLSPEEKAYIQDHAERNEAVPLAVEHDNYPASFYNPQEKEWQGIALDVLAEVEELSGLRFRRVNDEIMEWSELMAMLERGDAALVTQLIHSSDREGRFLWADAPYQRDSFALLSKSDFRDLGITEIHYARIGLIGGSGFADLFQEWFPGHADTVEYGTTIDGFTALEQGDVDLLMASMNLLLSQTNLREQPGYKANIVFNHSFESSFGFNIREAALKSIVDKSLRIIDTAGIAERWTRKTFDYRSKLLRSQIPWLIGFSALTLFVLILLFVMFQRNRRQGRRLENLVYQRTRELKAQTEEAHAASQAKTEFLAQMSHEIRTPMNAVIGMSHLTLQEEMSPQAREYVENIRRAGDNLMSIINDILDFSRIESGRLNIVPGEYQFASLINDSLSIIRTRLHEKPVLMFTMIDSTLPRQLVGDEARIRQILLNLLSNAVKYTREGHIILGIRGEKSADGRKIVLSFEVADTGVGIKQEDMGMLFGNFVRIDAKQNRGIEGTGLGLAITRRLCQLMGGDITVQSVYGKGSTFTAFLPQVVADGRPFAQVEAPEAKPVLIYENRRISGESLEYTLKNLGVSCSLADSREGLAEFLEKGNYRFVFMPSVLYTEFRDILEKQKIRSGDSGLLSLSGITPVLFAEYGEAIRTEIKTLMMPIHPAAVAGILNGRASDAGYNHVQKSRIRFTAPDARILVVDDMATNLDVIAGLLAPYKVRIDRALEGQEAVHLIRKNRYDMVFMDHMMPGMDGIEATEIVRKSEGDYFKDLPVIALTANALSGMREMFLEKGFNDYLSKPINISSLDVLLGKWIPGKKKIKEESWEKPETGEPGHAGIENAGITGTPLFPAIEGLDIARGLANTGGTEEGYRRVLASFVWDAEDRLKHISGLPGADDLAAFTIHVHALKGAAGSIGAAELSADAARLETAGRSGDGETIRELLPSFRERLSVLAGKIGETLEKGNGQGAGKEREGEARQDDPALGEKISPLREALESFNMDEIERLIAEMEKLAGDSKTRQIIARLSHHVLLCDYDEAIEALDELPKPPQ